MLRNLFLGLATFSFIQCSNPKEYTYPKNMFISNNEGAPKDSTTFYFPSVIEDKITDIDTFTQNWYSDVLHAAEEPVLYNFYLGSSSYRFLWLRAFNDPIVISLHNKDGKVWLTLKRLKETLESTNSKYITKYQNDLTGEELEPSFKVLTDPVDTLAGAKFEYQIISSETKQLTGKEWKEFEKLLSDCSFWTAEPHIEDWGLDGSQWIIEAHLKNRYRFIDRWAPQDNFKNAGQYLIKISGLKEDIY
jgi:hypothetical protein